MYLYKEYSIDSIYISHVSSSMSFTVRYHINIVSTVALGVKYLITIIKNVSLCDITGMHVH
jgi:hypothetical protein